LFITSKLANMSSATSDFNGWVAHDPSAADGNMKWGNFEPKTFEDTDIEMDISHCGVCGSDIHTLRSGWGPSDYPLVVGHEIIGHVTKVGKDVKDLKVGDRVGVGAQSECCEDCRPCKMQQESNCNKFCMTYNGKHLNGDKSYGGYAKAWRGPASFAIPIPEGLPSEFAAPLMCGGVTVYNPLVTYGAGPGKRVGVVGVGGLGHFALLFAKAMGADEVVAISRSSSKKEDAIKLGADRFIATGEDPEWATKNANGLDLIISTISGSFPLDQYLQLLDVNGTFVQLGAPDDPLPSFSPMGLIFKNLKIAGSLIGTRQHIRDMLELAKSTNLQAWVQVRPMSEANQVIVDFEKGLPRYRYVLKN
jgi:alcohol dehydrogenase (NADP+)